MITNINCIKNVGKFKNCNSGGITLTNKVVVFGKNTNGKSTLTSIFTSLREKNNDLIIGRKSFDATENPEVIIKVNDKNYIFRNNVWNEEFSKIEVFDTKFITDNVCNTEEINFQQQQNLNGVLLGDVGKIKLHEIKSLTEQINQLGVQKREITTFLTPILKGNLTVEEFSKLEQDTDVDRKIKEKEEEIEQLKNKTKLLSKINNSFFKFNFESIKEIAKSQVEVDYNSIKDHLEKHHLETSQGKKFLQDGSNLSRDDSCIFCGQNLDESAKKLIESYREVFSSKFVEFQRQVINTIDSFENMNFKDKIAKERLELQELGLSLDLSDEKISDLVSSKNSLLETIKPKKEDLSLSIDLDADEHFKKLTMEFNHINSILQKEKESLSKDKELVDLNKELDILKLTKERYNQEIVEKVDNYNGLNIETERLSSQRQTKNTELESYATDIFQRYRDKINSYLVELNANFTLDDFSHLKKLRGQDEFLFTISFDSCPNISPYQREHNQPCFRNTLSESDKRTLAFAFFLSKLSLDSDLDKKVVIFDDPISSFDKERKRKTKHLLLDVNCDGKKPEQIIVLTHQEDFLKEITRELDTFGENYTALKINSGQICLVSNINKEFPDDEVLNKLERLKELNAEDSIEENFFGDCRIVFENILKRKYFEKLSPVIAENPRASVRTFVDTIYENGDFKTKFIRLCNDMQFPLHDNSIPEPTDGDKKSILKDFFEVLREI